MSLELLEWALFEGWRLRVSSHLAKTLTIAFEQGLNVVTGPNGSGK